VAVVVALTGATITGAVAMVSARNIVIQFTTTQGSVGHSAKMSEVMDAQDMRSRASTVEEGLKIVGAALRARMCAAATL
jgi:hypothetical protein